MAKVLVTGGTGFVGSHAVAALIDAGHDVRLLVRSMERVAPALDPLGETADDVVVGDIMDRSSIDAAVAGCGAVVHAANIFSFHPRTHNKMLQVNVEGTRNVLEAAVDANVEAIVHVSSTLALIPSADERLTPDSAVGMPRPAYSKSKAAAERVARDFQQNGAPVVIVNPGSVWGPHDPHLGESAQLAISALKGRLRLVNDGVMSMVDVRDVGATITGVVDPKFAGRRFIVVGHDLQFSDLLGKMGELTGRNLRPMRVPAAMAMGLGRAFDWISSSSGLRLPIGYEPPWVIANNKPADSGATEEALGIKWRSLEDSLLDTIRWLYEQGHVSQREVGDLAA